MNIKSKVLWTTRTAVFIALLVILQMATASLGNTIVTGSIVNMMLIVSLMTCGLSSGLSVAVVSPIMAKIIGIGPFWSLIPFIIAGNIALISVWHFIGNRKMERKHTAAIVALICAAIAKFLVLYIGIVRIAIPILLGLPEQQAVVISYMFSMPQLITALIGGIIAFILLPTLKKAIGGR
ncbi:MAG: ECF transporter S component [Oscillospiraceae bacterium]|nr:ECF transporter S component [Oscillospiraceae bacterium]